MSDDVTKWLEKLGLGQYASDFADNHIDIQLLTRLTSDDLKELGVGSLGHRMTILSAIEALSLEDSHSIAVVTHSGEAERRQLTVMFCDLAGSTEMSQVLDPEDLRDLNRAYQDACQQAIERYDGYVARYMGDGVLAYFGYPQAHEDDAERAVMSGLDVVEAMNKLNAGIGREKDIQVAVRVGIATGPTVVGDLIGEGASQESAAVGETPNLAARLQGIAEPNSVVVAPDTHRLTTGYFDYRGLGPRTLKGMALPIETWQALGKGTAETRFEAMHGQRLSPLVGRDEELALLFRRWERAKDNEGQVVLISGEPGLGKSRLCAALQERIVEQSHSRLQYQCSPHHTNSALYPVIRQLERAAKIESQSLAEEKLDRLERFLNQSTDVMCDEDVSLLATLLSIPLGERYGPISTDAQEQKERTLRALVREIEGLCTRRPLLIIFEDLHWVDPSSRELLDRLVERAENLPVLMLITFRPEIHLPWAGQGHVTPLTLNRISKRESRAMLNGVTGAESLSESLVNEIVAKTDGVPLFIEETTRTVLEVERKDGTGALDDTPLEVPATLQDSLVARLDRLTIGKQVAQTGAAIGREFTEQLLESVCELDRPKLDQALDELVDSGLLFRRGSGSGAACLFKHALLQDAAYNSLLLATRRSLHRRIAKALTSQSPEQAALLAHHWERAEEFDKALHYWLEAVERARRLYARPEAVAQIWRALDLLEQLPTTIETWRRQVDTVVAATLLGTTFWRTEEERAKALRHLDNAICVAMGNGDLANAARLEAYKGYYLRDESLLAKALADSEASGEQAAQAETAAMYSDYSGEIGRFEDSRAHADRAIELYGQLGESVLQAFLLVVQGRCYSARAGRIDDSLRYASRARQIAEAHDDPWLESWFVMECEPYMYRGLWEETVQIAKQGLPIASKIGNWNVVLFSSAWAAIAYVKLGRLEDARRVLDEALAGVEERHGYDYSRAYHSLALAQLYLAENKIEKALMSVRQAVDLAERGTYPLEHGASSRMFGQIYEAGGNFTEANAAYRRSLEILENIESPPELAQSLLAYGRFKLHEDADEGNRLLNRALELFREMDATGWIEEVQTALDA